MLRRLAARPGTASLPLDEWIVAGWQPRPHDALRDPLAPARVLSLNEKSAKLTFGFAFQGEPASRAACPHCPIPHGGTNPGPDAAAGLARPDPHRPAFSRSATISG